MTNEDIIKAVEAFVWWGDEDKRTVVRTLSDEAVSNMIYWLGQTRAGRGVTVLPHEPNADCI